MGSRNSIESLRDSDPVNVIIKTADNDRRGGSTMIKSMSMNVAMEIESAGIIAATVTKKDMHYLAQQPNIQSIEVDTTVYALEDTAGYVRNLAEDTPFGIPMVLEDMNFWKELGAPSGSIKVCVADTGYDPGHEDLPTASDVTGSDSSSNGSWDSDGHGHGTHCSGTVAGLGENSKGVVGVIPDNMNGKFQLVIGKALSDSGSGSSSGVLGAVQSCVDNGAKVISLSLGGGGYSSTTNEFYNNLYENEDILFVAAAGNGGSSSKLYPASYPALMSVAAIDSTLSRSSFSQYNDQVEISAPGVSVKSSLPNDKYASWSGTSMATPHVAGVAGLLWMHFPECKNYEIRNVLAATAEDLKASGCDMNTGYGLVQAKNAYELLSEGNCGGNIGQTSPVGGCEQLVPVGPTAAPTPQCASDSDCDDGDTCTVNTCDNGLCESLLSCSLCAKSEVKVEITTDNYGAETSFDIKDNSGDNIMEGGDYESATTYAESTCVGGGSYTFTINDSYGDGICCAYGSGSYSVKVNDEEVASGGEFSGSTEVKQFDVDNMSEPPATPPPTTGSPTGSPSSGPSVDVTPTPTILTPSPSAPNNTPPTDYPTHTPPTLYPTQRPPTINPTSIPPTPFPTGRRPTLFPTGTPPTLFPTHTPPTMHPTSIRDTVSSNESIPIASPIKKCAVKNESCTKWSDCCESSCSRWPQPCRN